MLDREGQALQILFISSREFFRSTKILAQLSLPTGGMKAIYENGNSFYRFFAMFDKWVKLHCHELLRPKGASKLAHSKGFANSSAFLKTSGLSFFLQPVVSCVPMFARIPIRTAGLNDNAHGQDFLDI